MRRFRPYFLALACVLSVPAYSQRAQAPITISQIRIEGTQRIEPETVQSYLTIRPGEPYDQDKLDESVKSLFATGLFADVTIRPEGSTLVVNVVENPIINRIAFEGNRKIESDKLEQELQLRPRIVYTRTKVQADADRILEVYRRGGRYSARVEPKVIVLDQNRVDLVFEIDEGPRTPVRRITFIGDKQFDADELRDQIQTRESAWWRFLSSNDSYDPDRVQFDKELLRRFYLANGYADFRVVSAVAELTPDRQDFFLTFTVDEGERYKFGKIDVRTTLKNLDPQVLRDRIGIFEGAWYNANQIEDTITQLTNAVSDLQYAFVDVRPQIQRNRETHTIDVLFDVSEGPRVFVERINITGNVQTVDEVIRREMRLAEGDPFNKDKMKKSEQRLKDLGFFEKVDITNEPGSEPDRTVLNVNVTEQSTGEIQIGAGYSSTDGLLVDFRIRQRNLLGEGKDARLSIVASGVTQEFDLGYTQPYFLNRDLALGVDLYHTLRNYTQDYTTGAYDIQNTGIAFTTGYPLSEHLRQRLSYRIESDSVTNIDPSASIYVQDQAGTRTVSQIGQSLEYDVRDSRLEPTRGYLLSFGTDLAGLGGNTRYVRTTVGGSIYYTLAENWILELASEVGYIVGLGQDVRLTNRYFIGGDTLRGFKVAGIGPRDTDTNDALGGNHYGKATAEVTFPLGLPSEFGVKAHFFTDAGTLAGIDGPKGPTVVDRDALRMTSGIGLSWKSPFGPLRIDIGYPYFKEKYDKTEAFHFNFGTKF